MCVGGVVCVGQWRALKEPYIKPSSSSSSSAIIIIIYPLMSAPPNAAPTAANGYGWGQTAAAAAAVVPETVDPEDEAAKAEAEAMKDYESDMRWWCGLRAVARSGVRSAGCGLSTIAVAV